MTLQNICQLCPILKLLVSSGPLLYCEDMKEPPKSAFSRTAKLLGSGARAAFKEVRGRTSEAIRSKVREEQLELIVSTLGQLKGSAMKAGQMLALETQDWLPPELQAILLKLNSKADPVHFSHMEKVLREELGEKLKELNLSSEPIAAASIGQVYKGCLGDTEVAVKVQYPGVSKTVGSDLKVLQKLMQGLNFAAGKKVELKELFEELEIVLIRETQYQTELKNMQKYRELLSPYEEYIVPRPFPEYSTDRVLTMEYLPGVELHHWIDTRPSQQARERMGELLISLYLKEFYLFGLVQTDPNLANFLVDNETDTLQLLDFGSVISYDFNFRKEYWNFSDLILSNDFERTLEKSYELGLLSERESMETKRKFFEMLKLSVIPFNEERFSFRDKDYAQKSRQIVWDFIRSLKYTPPPRQIIFLHRRLGGLFQTLKKMDLELNLRSYLDTIPDLLEQAEASHQK